MTEREALDMPLALLRERMADPQADGIPEEDRPVYALAAELSAKAKAADKAELNGILRRVYDLPDATALSVMRAIVIVRPDALLRPRGAELLRKHMKILMLPKQPWPHRQPVNPS